MFNPVLYFLNLALYSSFAKTGSRKNCGSTFKLFYRNGDVLRHRNPPIHGDPSAIQGSIMSSTCNLNISKKCSLSMSLLNFFLKICFTEIEIYWSYKLFQNKSYVKKKTILFVTFNFRIIAYKQTKIIYNKGPLTIYVYYS